MWRPSGRLGRLGCLGKAGAKQRGRGRLAGLGWFGPRRGALVVPAIVEESELDGEEDRQDGLQDTCHDAGVVEVLGEELACLGLGLGLGPGWGLVGFGFGFGAGVRAGAGRGGGGGEGQVRFSLSAREEL